MKLLQGLLSIVGATAFGIGLGTCGTYFVLSLLFEEPRGEKWGGAVIWMALTLGGGVVGALVGFIGSFRWIMQHEGRLWPLRRWFGLALGVAIGVLMTYFTSSRYFWWFQLLRAAFFVPMFALLTAALAELAARSPPRNVGRPSPPKLPRTKQRQDKRKKTREK